MRCLPLLLRCLPICYYLPLQAADALALTHLRQSTAADSGGAQATPPPTRTAPSPSRGAAGACLPADLAAAWAAAEGRPARGGRRRGAARRPRRWRRPATRARALACLDGRALGQGWRQGWRQSSGRSWCFGARVFVFELDLRLRFQAAAWGLRLSVCGSRFAVRDSRSAVRGLRLGLRLEGLG